MKAIFIAYDQAHHDKIVDALTRLNCRGFTSFGEVQGRGSHTGDPHYGSHAWPSLGGALLTMVDDHQVDGVLQRLKEFDDDRPKLGLRAFVWDVERTI